MSRTAKINIYTCYAHEDETYRKGLEKQLRVLQQQGAIDLLHDRQIKAGALRKQEINTSIHRAHIILLLVSPDFVASDYCYGDEMKLAMQRHARGEVRVIPIILRRVHWQDTPFGSLQPLPADGQPISSSRWPNRDEAFFNVAEGIRSVVHAFILPTASPAPPRTASRMPPSQPRRNSGRQTAVPPEAPARFLFNEPLPAPDEFFGRERERLTLLSRTRNRACTSIVGPRRIGKTWLVEHLRFIAPTRLGPDLRLGFIDATLPSASSIAGFTARALTELGLSAPENTYVFPLAALEEGIRELRRANQIPVLCIDEFEGFARKPEFDLEFFTDLRAITQLGLCLIVLSKQPIIDIVSQRAQTSPFFNVFEQVLLKPFSHEDARAFAQAKAARIGLSDSEQAWLLEYGQAAPQQWLPMRLQLAGKMLLEEKEQGLYQPNDPGYRRDFVYRLEETYGAVVP